LSHLGTPLLEFSDSRRHRRPNVASGISLATFRGVRWVLSDVQQCPNGSSIWPCRSPQNMSATGRRIAAPAVTACIGDRAPKMHPANQHQQDHQNNTHWDLPSPRIRIPPA
jgi:hypothetical protein